MTWFHLQPPVFNLLVKHWKARKQGGHGKCRDAPAFFCSTPANYQSSKRLILIKKKKNAVTSSCLGVDCLCSKGWMQKTQQGATSLYIWGTQMDSTGSCPIPVGESTASPPLKFPIWSNAYISHNLIHVLIIFIYRIKIQNFLSSDHSNTLCTSEEWLKTLTSTWSNT